MPDLEYYVNIKVGADTTKATESLDDMMKAVGEVKTRTIDAANIMREKFGEAGETASSHLRELAQEADQVYASMSKKQRAMADAGDVDRLMTPAETVKMMGSLMSKYETLTNPKSPYSVSSIEQSLSSMTQEATQAFKELKLGFSDMIGMMTNSKNRMPKNRIGVKMTATSGLVREDNIEYDVSKMLKQQMTKEMLLSKGFTTDSAAGKSIVELALKSLMPTTSTKYAQDSMARHGGIELTPANIMEAVKTGMLNATIQQSAINGVLNIPKNNLPSSESGKYITAAAADKLAKVLEGANGATIKALAANNVITRNAKGTFDINTSMPRGELEDTIRRVLSLEFDKTARGLYTEKRVYNPTTQDFYETKTAKDRERDAKEGTKRPDLYVISSKNQEHYANVVRQGRAGEAVRLSNEIGAIVLDNGSFDVAPASTRASMKKVPKESQQIYTMEQLVYNPETKAFEHSKQITLNESDWTRTAQATTNWYNHPSNAGRGMRRVKPTLDYNFEDYGDTKAFKILDTSKMDLNDADQKALFERQFLERRDSKGAIVAPESGYIALNTHGMGRGDVRLVAYDLYTATNERMKPYMDATFGPNTNSNYWYGGYSPDAKLNESDRAKAFDAMNKQATPSTLVFGRDMISIEDYNALAEEEQKQYRKALSDSTKYVKKFNGKVRVINFENKGGNAPSFLSTLAAGTILEGTKGFENDTKASALDGIMIVPEMYIPNAEDKGGFQARGLSLGKGSVVVEKDPTASFRKQGYERLPSAFGKTTEYGEGDIFVDESFLKSFAAYKNIQKEEGMNEMAFLGYLAKTLQTQIEEQGIEKVTDYTHDRDAEKSGTQFASMIFPSAARAVAQADELNKIFKALDTSEGIEEYIYKNRPDAPRTVEGLIDITDERVKSAVEEFKRTKILDVYRGEIASIGEEEFRQQRLLRNSSLGGILYDTTLLNDAEATDRAKEEARTRLAKRYADAESILRSNFSEEELNAYSLLDENGKFDVEIYNKLATLDGLYKRNKEGTLKKIGEVVEDYEDENSLISTLYRAPGIQGQRISGAFNISKLMKPIHQYYGDTLKSGVGVGLLGQYLLSGADFDADEAKNFQDALTNGKLFNKLGLEDNLANRMTFANSIIDGTFLENYKDKMTDEIAAEYEKLAKISVPLMAIATTKKENALLEEEKKAPGYIQLLEKAVSQITAKPVGDPKSLNNVEAIFENLRNTQEGRMYMGMASNDAMRNASALMKNDPNTLRMAKSLLDAWAYDKGTTNAKRPQAYQFNQGKGGFQYLYEGSRLGQRNAKAADIIGAAFNVKYDPSERRYYLPGTTDEGRTYLNSDEVIKAANQDKGFDIFNQFIAKSILAQGEKGGIDRGTTGSRQFGKFTLPYVANFAGYDYSEASMNGRFGLMNLFGEGLGGTRQDYETILKALNKTNLYDNPLIDNGLKENNNKYYKKNSELAKLIREYNKIVAGEMAGVQFALSEAQRDNLTALLASSEVEFEKVAMDLLYNVKANGTRYEKDEKKEKGLEVKDIIKASKLRSMYASEGEGAVKDEDLIRKYQKDIKTLVWNTVYERVMGSGNTVKEFDAMINLSDLTEEQKARYKAILKSSTLLYGGVDAENRADIVKGNGRYLDLKAQQEQKYGFKDSMADWYSMDDKEWNKKVYFDEFSRLIGYARQKSVGSDDAENYFANILKEYGVDRNTLGRIRNLYSGQGTQSDVDALAAFAERNRFIFKTPELSDTFTETNAERMVSEQMSFIDTVSAVGTIKTLSERRKEIDNKLKDENNKQVKDVEEINKLEEEKRQVDALIQNNQSVILSNSDVSLFDRYQRLASASDSAMRMNKLNSYFARMTAQFNGTEDVGEGINTREENNISQFFNNLQYGYQKLNTFSESDKHYSEYAQLAGAVRNGAEGAQSFLDAYIRSIFEKGYQTQEQQLNKSPLYENFRNIQTNLENEKKNVLKVPEDVLRGGLLAYMGANKIGTKEQVNNINETKDTNQLINWIKQQIKIVENIEDEKERTAKQESAPYKALLAALSAGELGINLRNNGGRDTATKNINDAIAENKRQYIVDLLNKINALKKLIKQQKENGSRYGSTNEDSRKLQKQIDEAKAELDTLIREQEKGKIKIDDNIVNSVKTGVDDLLAERDNISPEKLAESRIVSFKDIYQNKIDKFKVSLNKKTFISKESIDLKRGEIDNIIDALEDVLTEAMADGNQAIIDVVKGVLENANNVKNEFEKKANVDPDVQRANDLDKLFNISLITNQILTSNVSNKYAFGSKLIKDKARMDKISEIKKQIDEVQEMLASELSKNIDERNQSIVGTLQKQLDLLMSEIDKIKNGNNHIGENAYSEYKSNIKKNNRKRNYDYSKTISDAYEEFGIKNYRYLDFSGKNPVINNVSDLMSKSFREGRASSELITDYNNAGFFRNKAQLRKQEFDLSSKIVEYQKMINERRKRDDVYGINIELDRELKAFEKFVKKLEVKLNENLAIDKLINKQEEYLASHPTAQGKERELAGLTPEEFSRLKRRMNQFSAPVFSIGNTKASIDDILSMDEKVKLYTDYLMFETNNDRAKSSFIYGGRSFGRDFGDQMISSEISRRENYTKTLSILFKDANKRATNLTLTDAEREVAKDERNKYARDIAENINKINKLREEYGSLGSEVKGTFALMSRSAIQFAQRGLRTLINESKRFIKEFDESMATISAININNKTFDIEEVKTNAVETAKALKTSVKNVTSVQEGLYRQGLSQAEVEKRTELVLKYSAVTGTNPANALKNLTAAVSNGLVSNVEKAMDVLVALGDTVATTADEIAKGMQKSAAAAKNAGVDYEELTTMLAIGTASTQLGGNQIGRALNTMMSRYRKVTTKGITDAAGGSQSLNEVESALALVGISLRESPTSNSFRDFTDVMVDISERWDDISDVLKSNISYTMAGTMQSNVFQSLMEGMSNGINGQSFAELLETARNSEGTTDKKYEAKIQTLNASIEKLKASFDGLIANVGNTSGVLSAIASGLSSIFSFLGNNKFSSNIVAAGTAISALLFKINPKFGAIAAGITLTASVIGSAVESIASYNSSIKQAADNNKTVSEITESYTSQIKKTNVLTSTISDIISDIDTEDEAERNKTLKESVSSAEYTQIEELYNVLAEQYPSLKKFSGGLDLATVSVGEFADKINNVNKEANKKTTTENIRALSKVDFAEQKMNDYLMLNSAYDNDENTDVRIANLYPLWAALYKSGISDASIDTLKTFEANGYDVSKFTKDDLLQLAYGGFNINASDADVIGSIIKSYSISPEYYKNRADISKAADVLDIANSNKQIARTNIEQKINLVSDYLEALGIDEDTISGLIDVMVNQFGDAIYTWNDDTLNKAIKEFLTKNIINPLSSGLTGEDINYNYANRIYSSGYDANGNPINYYVTKDSGETAAYQRFLINQNMEDTTAAFVESMSGINAVDLFEVSLKETEQYYKAEEEYNKIAESNYNKAEVVNAELEAQIANNEILDETISNIERKNRDNESILKVRERALEKATIRRTGIETAISENESNISEKENTISSIKEEISNAEEAYIAAVNEADDYANGIYDAACEIWEQKNTIDELKNKFNDKYGFEFNSEKGSGLNNERFAANEQLTEATKKLSKAKEAYEIKRQSINDEINDIDELLSEIDLWYSEQETLKSMQSEYKENGGLTLSQINAKKTEYQNQYDEYKEEYDSLKNNTNYYELGIQSLVKNFGYSYSDFFNSDTGEINVDYLKKIANNVYNDMPLYKNPVDRSIVDDIYKYVFSHDEEIQRVVNRMEELNTLMSDIETAIGELDYLTELNNKIKQFTNYLGNKSAVLIPEEYREMYRNGSTLEEIRAAIISKEEILEAAYNVAFEDSEEITAIQTEIENLKALIDIFDVQIADRDIVYSAIDKLFDLDMSFGYDKKYLNGNPDDIAEQLNEAVEVTREEVDRLTKDSSVLSSEIATINSANAALQKSLLTAIEEEGTAAEKVSEIKSNISENEDLIHYYELQKAQKTVEALEAGYKYNRYINRGNTASAEATTNGIIAAENTALNEKLFSTYFVPLMEMLDGTTELTANNLRKWIQTVEENGIVLKEETRAIINDYITVMEELADQYELSDDALAASAGKLFDLTTGRYVNESAQSYLTNRFGYTETINKKEFAQFVKGFEDSETPLLDFWKTLNDDVELLNKYSSYIGTESFSDAVNAIETGTGSYKDLINAVIEFASSITEETIYAADFFNGLVEQTNKLDLVNKIASGNYTTQEANAFDEMFGLKTGYLTAEQRALYAQYQSNTINEERNKNLSTQASALVNDIYALGKANNFDMTGWNETTTLEQMLSDLGNAGINVSSLMGIYEILKLSGANIKGIYRNANSDFYTGEDGKIYSYTYAGAMEERINDNGEKEYWTTKAATTDNGKIIYSDGVNDYIATKYNTDGSIAEYASINGESKTIGTELTEGFVMTEQNGKVSFVTESATGMIYYPMYDSNGNVVGYTSANSISAADIGDISMKTEEIKAGNAETDVMGTSTTITDVNVSSFEALMNTMAGQNDAYTKAAQDRFSSMFGSGMSYDEIKSAVEGDTNLMNLVSSSEDLQQILYDLSKGFIDVDEATERWNKSLNKTQAAINATKSTMRSMDKEIKNTQYYISKGKNKWTSEDKNNIAAMFGYKDWKEAKSMGYTLDMAEADLKGIQTQNFDELRDEVNNMIGDEFKNELGEVIVPGPNIVIGESAVTIDSSNTALLDTMGLEQSVKDRVAYLTSLGYEVQFEKVQSYDDNGVLMGEKWQVKNSGIQLGSKYSSGVKSSGSGGSSKDKVKEKWDKVIAVDKHLVNMIQAKENRLQSAGKLTDYGNVLAQENTYQQKYINDLKSAIKEEKAYMNTLKKNSDEWQSAKETVMSWEEAIEDATNAMEENNRKLKENQEAIRQTRIELEQTVRDQIEESRQIERDMLDGQVSLENTVLDAIRQRYQDESDLRVKNYEQQKEYLEKEKELLEERFNARKENTDRIQKEEELAELKRQYASISLDSTRSRERLELAKKIADMEREINDQNDQEILEAKTAALDEQIAAYDDMIEVEQNDIEDFLSDANNMAEELNSILEKSQEDLLVWLQDNVHEFSNLTEAAQKQMINSWTDTYEQYKHIIHMWNEEIDNILTSKNKFLEYMKQSDSYVLGDEETRASLLYQWGEQYDAFVNAYQDNNASFSHTDTWGSGSGSSSSSTTSDNTKATNTNTDAVKAQTAATTNATTTIKDVISNIGSTFVAAGNNIINGLKSVLSGTTSITKYATGGLVDYTGLAWLDGTPSKPEYVLNSDQWQQLIGFKYHGYSVDTSGYGTNNSVSVGDIVINAAHIDDDADVEKLANRIGEIFSNKINESGFSTSRFCYR